VVFKGKAVVAASLSAAALFLGAAEASAAAFDWNFRSVLTGFNSRYWDTAGGDTTVRVSSCWSSYNYGGSGLSLNLWENRGWAPDVDQGSRGYRCSGSTQSVEGGSGTWSHTNGRFYFKVTGTPNRYGTNANGSTSYPG
jgi:hypothetical protein